MRATGRCREWRRSARSRGQLSTHHMPNQSLPLFGRELFDLFK